MAIFAAELILLLFFGRLIGEGMARIGQPAIFGQLLAGVLLGPSIFGALLTAGYAAAIASHIAAAPNKQQITSSVQAGLQKSFGSAADIAKQYPQYASHIIQAAKASFLAGDQWAYLAGIVVILLGGVLVFFLFPKMDEEKKLLAEYHAEDTDVAA